MSESFLLQGKDAGIAKLLVGAGPAHAGMGIVIGPRHILTCAHVVNVAVGLDIADTPIPTVDVAVAFPLMESEQPISAKVVAWRSMGDAIDADIAILELAADVPPTVGSTIFANVIERSLDDDDISVFGIPGGQRRGNHVDAKFKGPIGGPLMQIDGADDGGAFIVGGYSGAAVWDKDHDAAVGMIVAKATANSSDGVVPPLIAYLIPTQVLRSVWAALPVEDRGTSAYFEWAVVGVGAFLFLSLFDHWLVDRGNQSLLGLALVKDHPQLAAFWGMHIFAVIAPILSYMLLLYARAFRLHPWEQRVPPLPGLARVSKRGGRKAISRGVLIAFALLPLAAQIHFIQRFNAEGKVYIYPGRFGYSPGELQDCLPRAVPLCTHPAAGRYATVKPKPPADPGYWDGYWDNAYHYGERKDGASQQSVTFFPILQPLMVISLTLLACAMLIRLGLQLSFPRGMRLWRPASSEPIGTARPTGPA